MAFSRGMKGIVATTGRDKRRVNDRLQDDILLVVIAPSGATMTPNGVSTAGHAGSHAWGDCVRHQSLRAMVRRSLNQESHSFSCVECQVAGTGKMVHPPRKGTSPQHDHRAVAPSWNAIGRGHRASRS